MNKLNTIDILGVNVNDTNLSLSCDVIDSWIKSGTKEYICISPVATIVDCQKDEEYKKVVNASGMTTPDGMPVVWMGKLKGSKVIQRTYGPDLMIKLCSIGQGRGYKHFFYGGSEKTNQLLIEEIKKRFPGINIVGGYSPPIRALHTREDDIVINEINKSEADIVWIGLGSPKQDFWMAEHRGKLTAPVIVGVRAAFDFIAGTKNQAPKWMRRSGLEWLFRLCCEPKRLWKRYLIGNSLFVFLVLKDYIKSFFKESPSVIT